MADASSPDDENDDDDVGDFEDVDDCDDYGDCDDLDNYDILWPQLWPKYCLLQQSRKALLHSLDHRGCRSPAQYDDGDDDDDDDDDDNGVDDDKYDHLD